MRRSSDRYSNLNLQLSSSCLTINEVSLGLQQRAVAMVPTPLSIVREAKDFLNESLQLQTRGPCRRSGAVPEPSFKVSAVSPREAGHRLVASCRLPALRRGLFSQGDCYVPEPLAACHSGHASAPPTRGTFVDAPGRLPSPPRTDPPRRRKAKKARPLNAFDISDGRGALPPDSPMPLPPVDRKRLLEAEASLRGFVHDEEARETPSTTFEGIEVDVEGSGLKEYAHDLSIEGLCSEYFAAETAGKATVAAAAMRTEQVERSVEHEAAARFSSFMTPAGDEAARSGTGHAAAEADVLGSLLMRNDCDDWENASQLGDLSLGSGAAPSSLLHIEKRDESHSCQDEAMVSSDKQGATCSWIKGELIGRGSLGFVWKAMDRKTGHLIAVKEVVLDPRDQNEDKFRTSLQNEIELYKDLQHPRIVSYLGNDYMNGRLYIYLEYMSGGSLSQVLSQFGPLEEALAARYMLSIVEGLDYLHTREPPILHRDIKGANILVGLDGTVKLSDFGCSKQSNGTAHTLRGSVPWMAPEVMCQSGYGPKADIWSLGCVLIEMIIAAPPWGHFDNCLAAMVRIAMSDETPPIPSNASSACRNLITLCTCRSPSSRSSASELLGHPFIMGALDRSSAEASWGA